MKGAGETGTEWDAGIKARSPVGKRQPWIGFHGLHMGDEHRDLVSALDLIWI